MREREPGRWEVRVYVGLDPVSGKKRQVSRTVRGTKRDAQKVLTELAFESDRGRHKGTGTGTNFGNLVDAWLDLAKEDLEVSTLRRYHYLLNKHILPALGDRSVKEI